VQPSCSIVIPAHNRAGLTRQCLDAILAEPPSLPFELIVVDDASTDATAELLAGYSAPVRVLTRSQNGGFATACNEGAAEATGEQLVFLNNDTIPQPGWLDALARYADQHPAAAVVGSKLLFPDDSVQHAGVVICQDANPRHVYAGFPGDHPVVNRSRQFQAVTAACMLVRRAAFEQAGGFDNAFRNCLEDTDLCLRLRESGHEVHYCHESVLYHLESVSRGRRSKDIERNAKLFRERWSDKARRDDLDYYVADGLLRIHYRDGYPLGLELSPYLASVHVEGRRDEAERLLDAQSRHVTELLREAVRLTAYVADIELGGAGAAAARDEPAPEGEAAPIELDRFLRRAEELEAEIYELQAGLAAALGRAREPEDDDRRPFEPSEQLGYRKLVAEIRRAVAETLPAGAIIVVASRGDDELLELDGLQAWHFPQDEQGVYAGHYPADDAAAIEHLERLRERGAGYLLLPATALWWLERYPGLGTHVRERYGVALEDESCVIFSLD
jgi:GT2 family glycosyltransferase